ncbi:MAG: fumarylacetoacetate hydrolase family protein [Leptospirales bacterium]
MKILPDLPEGVLFVRFQDGDRVRPGILSLDGRSIHPLEGPGHGTISRDRVNLLSPVSPGKILAVGLNYRAHALEMGKPLPPEPLLFMKASSSLLHPGGTIRLNSMSTQVDFEGEIALVVGRKASRIPIREVRHYLYGITVANDVTARDLQRKDVQYTRAKSFDTFCPLGPAILVGALPESRTLETVVNGTRRQHSRASDMIFDAESLFSFISHIVTLEPGDVILTGTPSGVGQLSPGDLVEVSLEGVGTLSNKVDRDSGPVWTGFERG